MNKRRDETRKVKKKLEIDSIKLKIPNTRFQWIDLGVTEERNFDVLCAKSSHFTFHYVPCNASTMSDPVNSEHLVHLIFIHIFDACYFSAPADTHMHHFYLELTSIAK